MTHGTKRHGEPEASSPAVADFSHSLGRLRDFARSVVYSAVRAFCVRMSGPLLRRILGAFCLLRASRTFARKRSVIDRPRNQIDHFGLTRTPANPRSEPSVSRSRAQCGVGRPPNRGTSYGL